MKFIKNGKSYLKLGRVPPFPNKNGQFSLNIWIIRNCVFCQAIEMFFNIGAISHCRGPATLQKETTFNFLRQFVNYCQFAFFSFVGVRFFAVWYRYFLSCENSNFSISDFQLDFSFACLRTFIEIRLSENTASRKNEKITVALTCYNCNDCIHCFLFFSRKRKTVCRSHSIIEGFQWERRGLVANLTAVREWANQTERCKTRHLLK